MKLAVPGVMQDAPSGATSVLCQPPRPVAFCEQVMSIARIIKEEYAGGRDLSGIGGVETGRDAAEFILLGANTVQVGLILPARVPAGP